MSEPSDRVSSMQERLEQHERRITELEIEAAFRRKITDDLDEVVREQGRHIAALERRLAELIGSIDAVVDDE